MGKTHPTLQFLPSGTGRLDKEKLMDQKLDSLIVKSMRIKFIRSQMHTNAPFNLEKY